MKPKKEVGRRDFLRALGAVPVSRPPASAPLAQEAAADSESNEEKRKARYQANSPDVQAFYRVNRYPAKSKEAAVLIKRTESQARRGMLAGALPNHQAMAASTAAAFCAAPVSPPAASLRSARCNSARCARPRPDRRRPPARCSPLRKNICTHCSVGCTVIAEVANGVWIGQEPSYDSPINRGSHCARARRSASCAERASTAISDEARERAMEPDLLGSGDRRDRRQAHGDPRQVGTGIRSIGSAPPSSPTKPPISSANSPRSGERTIPIIKRASVIPPPSPASPIPGATAR